MPFKAYHLQVFRIFFAVQKAAITVEYFIFLLGSSITFTSQSLLKALETNPYLYTCIFICTCIQMYMQFIYILHE